LAGRGIVTPPRGGSHQGLLATASRCGTRLDRAGLLLEVAEQLEERGATLLVIEPLIEIAEHDAPRLPGDVSAGKPRQEEAARKA